jgi:hypothetical protein
MKSIKPLIVLASLALFGAGCTMSGSPLPASVLPVEGGKKPVETPVAMCAQTPQVYYFNKLAFSARELASIQSNVVDRVVAHYRTFPGHEVVSLMVRRNETGIIVDVIIDQPESEDPFYEGFVLDRGKDGLYPAYEPLDAGPGYEG